MTWLPLAARAARSTMQPVKVAGDDKANVRLAGIIAFGSVVGISSAIVLGSSDASLTHAEKSAALALGVAYFLIARRQLARMATPSGSYFAIQNLLALGFVWIGRDAAVLIPMPIITHAVLALRRRWVGFMAGLHAINWVLVVGLYRGWHDAPAAAGRMLAAQVFVVAFAEVVAGERRARAELRDANRKLAEYATQAEELATIRERNRLARELHDSLGHYLTVIHVQLQAALSQIGLNPDRAKQSLATAARLTHEGLEDVRRSVAALRPSPIDTQPLASAIGQLVDQLTASGVPSRLDVRGSPHPLPPPVELALYRTAQEALTNVRKHSRAQAASVFLEYGSGQVRLSVEDDGEATQPVVMGFGLVGVRERIRLVSGELEIRTERGFAITVTVPI